VQPEPRVAFVDAPGVRTKGGDTTGGRAISSSDQP